MTNTVCTATLNDRYIFKAGSLAKIKGTAGRIANKNHRMRSGRNGPSFGNDLKIHTMVAEFAVKLYNTSSNK
ncbi:MAG: hypothetical protein IJR62_02025 [Lachnospiraceae bacterium]|nr:hypothetical protein [Lachnospiraceae bacterium]